MSFAVTAIDITADGNPHWGMYNISNQRTFLPPGAGASGSTYGKQVLNWRDDQFYDGPCPPRFDERGPHNYVFTVYALNKQLQLPSNPGNVTELLLELDIAIPLASASITGTWSSTPK
jgi:phosphatidylethanolamine-binding protein (PEBP) family uncharacterized protein